MANKEQLAILKQGVAAWNKWREENPDVEIDLRGSRLNNLNLNGINLNNSDIRGANFRNSTLIRADFRESLLDDFSGSVNQPENDGNISDFSRSNLTCAMFNKAYIGRAKFSHAILTGVSWLDAFCWLNDFELNRHDNSYYGTILDDPHVRKLLMCGRGQRLLLKGKNLKGAYLVGFYLCGVDFRETYLMQADLRGADITGAKLYGSARENWIIDGIRCDYVYWDEAGKQRTPPDRDFRPGEFEELYKQLPTFEYIFEQGFTPLDPLIMDRVVQAVNERHKEFSLELVNFDKRGQPHATFTVCRLDYVEKAREQITAGYEESKGSPEQQAQLMDIISKLIDHNTLLAGNQSKSLDIIKQLGGSAMGDTTYNINVSGGQIAAVGTNASASGNIFQQITADLSRVHEEMQRNAKTPEQRAAADDVAKAAQAAQQQNEPAVRQHLKNAGKFALDCAQKIGAEALAEYLKKMTLGM